MSNHSIIEHRANYHFIKLEEDFLAICSNGKESPHCKALILSILEHWTNTKRDQDQGDYIYMSMPQWITSTYQLYERNILTDCLRELVEEGMIERRPIIMYAQKTFDYRLCIDVVQERIRGLSAKESVLPQLDAFAAFKERQKAERAEKREEVGEKSPTLETASDKSLDVGEKSPTVGDKPRRVRDKSRKVGDKSTQHRLTKTLLPSTKIVRSGAPAVATTNTRTSKEKGDIFAEVSSDIQAIVTEWRMIFKTPTPVTAKLVEHATTLAAFQPVPGEIMQCRLWMYQSDTKKWYASHGMHLGDVAREFERFRSLASMPEVAAPKGRQISSFDDPDYDMSSEFYPSPMEKASMSYATR